MKVKYVELVKDLDYDVVLVVVHFEDGTQQTVSNIKEWENV